MHLSHIAILVFVLLRSEVIPLQMFQRQGCLLVLVVVVIPPYIMYGNYITECYTLIILF